MRRTQALVFPTLILHLIHTACGIANGGSTVSTLVSFNGTNGATPTGSLTLNAQGNFYGTTQFGGAYGDGTVFKIAAGTHTLSTIASFNGANGANPVGGVTFDAHGKLFGATNIGGADNLGTVFEFVNNAGAVPEPTLIVTLGQAAALFGVGLAVRACRLRAQAR